MSVVIDIDMPKMCEDCPAFDNYWDTCNLTKKSPPIDFNNLDATHIMPRPDWCPLRELEEKKNAK
jgi:hypothetical protein